MKRRLLVPLLCASVLPLTSARADDLNDRAAQVKSQLQTQWLPAWAKISTANEPAADAALALKTLSHAARLGYATPDLNLLDAASAHYKLLRDSRRDKTNDGFYARPQDSKETAKSTLLQAQVVSGLVEYARASGQAEPRGVAIKIWRLIRERARDKINGGYYDSFLNGPLGPTDASGQGLKSAPAHLALLEAATALFDLTHDRSIRTDLLELLDLNQGRFFPVDGDNVSTQFTPDWKPVFQNGFGGGPLPLELSAAGVAIVRAQTVLGLPVGWVDFARRSEMDKSGDKPATVSALTSLTPIASNRDERATELDAALDGLNTSSPQSSVGNGIALLDFVAAIGK